MLEYLSGIQLHLVKPSWENVHSLFHWPFERAKVMCKNDVNKHETQVGQWEVLYHWKLPWKEVVMFTLEEFRKHSTLVRYKCLFWSWHSRKAYISLTFHKILNYFSISIQNLFNQLSHLLYGAMDSIALLKLLFRYDTN